MERRLPKHRVLKAPGSLFSGADRPTVEEERTGQAQARKRSEDLGASLHSFSFLNSLLPHIRQLSNFQQLQAPFS